MDKVEIIAEIGSNYDGSLDKAVEYIRASKRHGADAVKFQTFRRDKLVSRKIWTDGAASDNPAYYNFKNLELPDEWHHILKQEADKERIEFISTPLYLEAVDLLETVGVRTYKVASGDITFFPLLEKIGRTKKRVILSTGASSLEDISSALSVLSKSGAKDIVLLHCVSNYPPQPDEMNLRAITTLREKFGLPVGISDHSRGDLVPLAAVALGAVLIEKHITFDVSLPGPDHSYATGIEEFGVMAQRVRQLEKALGTGEKVPTKAELPRQQRLRRGIYDPRSCEPTNDKARGIWLRPE